MYQSCCLYFPPLTPIRRAHTPFRIFLMQQYLLCMRSYWCLTKNTQKKSQAFSALFSSFSRFADLNSNNSKKINTSDPFLFIFPRLWKRRSDTNCLRQTLHAGNYNGGTFQSVCYLPGFCVSVGGFWDEPPSPNHSKKENFYECLLRAFVDVLLPPCPVEP